MAVVAMMTEKEDMLVHISSHDVHTFTFNHF